jgi:hypothetical protein
MDPQVIPGSAGIDRRVRVIKVPRMMTYEEFAKLVQEMRDAQCTYFVTRERSDLQLAKGLENRVDRAAKEALGKQKPLRF